MDERIQEIEKVLTGDKNFESVELSVEKGKDRFSSQRYISAQNTGTKYRRLHTVSSTNIERKIPCHYLIGFTKINVKGELLPQGRRGMYLCGLLR